MLRNQKGFTLVELMVVVAIIGILAAIAIPQYNKFKGNAQLSNVQGMCKQMAKSAMSLGSGAQQNPACTGDAAVDITYTAPNLIATGQVSAAQCDKVDTGVTAGTPAWVAAVTITGLTVNTDGTVAAGGTIDVTSTYTYGGAILACSYDPATDTLTDGTGGQCHL